MTIANVEIVNCLSDLAYLLIKFKSMIIPLIIVGIMEQVNLKVDSKGRICIPAEIREQIGDTATLKKTNDGYLLLPGKQKDATEELHKIMTSKHRRTGKPENWSPEKMKSIWSKPQ